MPKQENSFWVRSICCCVFVAALAFCCILRLIRVGSTVLPAAALQNTVSVEVESGRGLIYDCKGRSVYTKKQQACVFLPCLQSLQTVQNYCGGSTLQQALQRLNNNLPFVLLQENKINQKGVYCTPVVNRAQAPYGLEHLLGYVNGEGQGVYGLELAYNSLLQSAAKTTLCFAVDAAGNYLLGAEPTLKNNRSSGAVYLTVDLDLQKAVFESCEGLKTGGVVVTEVQTGKIRAMLSRPGFDAQSLADYLKSPNSPFLNRCLSRYNVGSAFKPLIAAALLENGKGSFTYNCTGSCEIAGRRFYCHRHAGHGQVTLATALEQSCNTYFYNAAAQLSGQEYLNLSQALGFGSQRALANGITAAAGSLPTSATLTSKAALANFAIGQGELLLTPLALTNLYAAVANGGWYVTPSLVEGTRTVQGYRAENAGLKNVVFSSNTAGQLKGFLAGVLTNGTGKAALPAAGGACGKTATAQTGRVVNGAEVEHSWFCGFFPQESPKYAVTVFLENKSANTAVAAQIFKKIADSVGK